jgi:SAM-dependent methyltransferase
MKEVSRRLSPDGSLPAYSSGSAACSTAAAQYAVIWYKLGEHALADRAVAHLCRVQTENGGFVGSDGAGADYFPDSEISWAAKFFLDAVRWRIRCAFDNDVRLFPSTVSERDGRLQSIMSSLVRSDGKRILDAGCGKGRFAQSVAEQFPTAEIWGVDVSPEMLRSVPNSIRTREASLLNLPFPDDHFDFVYCVEALEHAVHPQAALRELTRVTKPGGTVLVIDKNRDQLGNLEMAPWERWFDRAELTDWLRNVCDSVESEVIADPDLPAGLFIAWRGTVKRNPVEMGPGQAAQT